MNLSPRASRTALLLASLALSAALAAPAPGTVQGTVLDTRGQPIKGALIWVKPGVTTGLVTARTDAQGRYAVTSLPDLPFNTTAWLQVPYRGQTFCVRLAAENDAQYAPFSPRAGVVRNFKWTLSGHVPDSDMVNMYFGAEVRVMSASWDGFEPVRLDTSRVELTFTPDGPLLDGSAGKTLRKTTALGDVLVYDVPVGHYRVSAVEIRPDGSRAPLTVGTYGAPAQGETTLDFKSSSMYCGGGPGTTSAVERAFVYVGRPAR